MNRHQNRCKPVLTGYGQGRPRRSFRTPLVYGYRCEWFHYSLGGRKSVAFNVQNCTYAHSDIHETAKDSVGKTAVFFFLPARPPALKRLKAARPPDERSSSTAPSLRNVLALVRVSKLL